MQVIVLTKHGSVVSDLFVKKSHLLHTVISISASASFCSKCKENLTSVPEFHSTGEDSEVYTRIPYAITILFVHL